MTHDPLCFDPVDWCVCDLIARVRDDERERVWAGIQSRSYVGRYQWAEAVAARLVEVICRIDEEAEWYTPSSLEMARHQRDAARKSLNNAEAAALVFKAERDAARAEVAALRNRLAEWEARWKEESDAEVAALREQWKGSWAANIRREVLAALRAKVEALPVGRTTPKGAAFVWRKEVLALFDEAQP